MGSEKWIWSSVGLRDHPEYVLFRKEITLDSVPERLPIQITADSRYILRINGRIAARGPARSNGAYRMVDEVDVAPFLKPGVNAVVIDAIHYVGDAHVAARFETGPCSVCSTGQGGLLICGDERFQTDGRYRCLSFEGYRFLPAGPAGYLGFFEELDGRAYPADCREAGFDDADWGAAAAVWENAPFINYGLASVWQLTPRTIPLPFERDCAPGGVTRAAAAADGIVRDGVRIPPHTRCWVEVDAGDYRTGYVNLEIDDGWGAEITLTYAECYQYDEDGRSGLKGVRDDYRRPGAYLTGDSDRYIAGRGRQAYTSYHYRAFRYVRLDIETHDEALDIRVPSITETGYPLEVRTDFRCDDDAYNRMWEISLKTLRSCMYETYMDCPHYEQMQYLMDTQLEMLYTYCVSDDKRLAEKAILDFYYAQLPNGLIPCNAPCNFTQIIPGFSLYWVFMLENYCLYHGDDQGRGIIRDCFPGVEKVLLFFKGKINADGLLDHTGFWQFVDWTPAWEAGIPTRSPAETNVIYCMMLTAACRSAARLCRYLDRPEQAAAYERDAQDLAAAVNRRCFDEGTGLYVDAIGRREKSQQAQIWAVLSGIASPERAVSVMRKAMADPSMSQSSFCMHYFLFRALEKTGLYALAEHQWRKWRELLPLNVLTWPEDNVNWRSDCHAWSSTPLYEFVACGLGVKPALPGYQQVMVAPRMLWLSTCSGSVVTPYGPLAVDWRIRDSVFTITLGTGTVTPIVLHLPDGQIKELLLHGEETFACPLETAILPVTASQAAIG